MNLLDESRSGFTGLALVSLMAYLTGLHCGLALPYALAGGFMAGLLVFLAGAVAGSIIARSVKKLNLRDRTPPAIFALRNNLASDD